MRCHLHCKKSLITWLPITNLNGAMIYTKSVSSSKRTIFHRRAIQVGHKFIRNFALFICKHSKFRTLMPAKWPLFFLISRIRASHWKNTPFFAKMGTSVVYILVGGRGRGHGWRRWIGGGGGGGGRAKTPFDSNVIRIHQDSITDTGSVDNTLGSKCMHVLINQTAGAGLFWQRPWYFPKICMQSFSVDGTSHVDARSLSHGPNSQHKGPR